MSKYQATKCMQQTKILWTVKEKANFRFVYKPSCPDMTIIIFNFIHILVCFSEAHDQIIRFV